MESAETRAAVEDMCMVFHQTVRHLADDFLRDAQRFYYATPTSYLELIQTFKELLTIKRSTVRCAATTLPQPPRLLPSCPRTAKRRGRSCASVTHSPHAAQVHQMKRRYEVGLEKLLAAESDVNIMKKELIELQPKLVETGKEVAQTLIVVDK